MIEMWASMVIALFVIVTIVGLILFRVAKQKDDTPKAEKTERKKSQSKKTPKPTEELDDITILKETMLDVYSKLTDKIKKVGNRVDLLEKNRSEDPFLKNMDTRLKMVEDDLKDLGSTIRGRNSSKKD